MAGRLEDCGDGENLGIRLPCAAWWRRKCHVCLVLTASRRSSAHSLGRPLASCRAHRVQQPTHRNARCQAVGPGLMEVLASSSDLALTDTAFITSNRTVLIVHMRGRSNVGWGRRGLSSAYVGMQAISGHRRGRQWASAGTPICSRNHGDRAFIRT